MKNKKEIKITLLEDYGSDNPDINQSIISDFIEYLKESFNISFDKARNYALAAIMLGEVEGQVSDGEFEDIENYELDWQVVNDEIEQKYLEFTDLQSSLIDDAIEYWNEIYRPSLYFGDSFCKSLLEYFWPSDWEWLEQTIEDHLIPSEEGFCPNCGRELNGDDYCPQCGKYADEWDESSIDDLII